MASRYKIQKLKHYGGWVSYEIDDTKTNMAVGTADTMTNARKLKAHIEKKNKGK